MHLHIYLSFCHIAVRSSSHGLPHVEEYLQASDSRHNVKSDHPSARMICEGIQDERGSYVCQKTIEELRAGAYGQKSGASTRTTQEK